jgi:CRISPR/Cas system-associated exonuclease Cas4 (RecB family)
MNDWVTAIKTRAAQVGPDVASADTLAKRRALAVTYFGDLADLTGQLVDKVKAEGAPNVSGGEASHTVFVNAFTAAQQIFVAAQTTAKSLPVDDAKAFKTAFNDSLTALKSASDQIGTALSALNAGDLDTAAAADSACQTIGQ